VYNSCDDMNELLTLKEENENRSSMATQSRPRNGELQHFLGITRYREGDFTDAVRLLKLAHEAAPCDSSVLANLGNALQETGALDEAILCLQQAVRIRPIFPEGYFNLGNALSKKADWELALKAYQQAIHQNPTYVNAYINQGLTHEALGLLDDARQSYEAALKINPTDVNGLINYGNLLLYLDLPKEAEKIHGRVITLDPLNAAGHYNRGKALYEQGRFAEAVSCYDKAIFIRSDYANAHASKALALLQVGEWEAGWPLFEWRWKAGNKIKRERSFNAPIWLGADDLRNRTILLHAEQGLGDTIQFCRYLPLVKALGARVLFEVPRVLFKLMDGLHGVDELVITGTCRLEYDFHCPLMSLPLALNTSVNSLPNVVPYLRATREKIDRWRAYLGDQGFKIAINWQGNKLNPLDKGRSFPLSMFEEISCIEGVRLISLQKKFGLEQLQLTTKSVRVELLPDDFDEGDSAFIDSAAVINCVDLVISSDTAVAHLAGSLGADTWIPLKYVPDWRWMTADINKNPWYPTARLYRQSAPGDWSSVFSGIARDINSLVREFDK